MEKEEYIAKANGKSLGISTKQAIEICSFIRNKNLQEAKNTLDDVTKMKMNVPFRRFTNGAGHKKKKKRSWKISCQGSRNY